LKREAVIPKFPGTLLSKTNSKKIIVACQGEKNQKKKLTGTSSTSTLRKIKPGYFLLSSMKIGDIMRHGPHQVAVKSTTICLQTPKIFKSSFNVKCM